MSANINENEYKFDSIIIANIIKHDFTVANSLMNTCSRINRQIHENNHLMHLIAVYYINQLEDNINFQIHRALNVSPIRKISSLWIDADARLMSPFSSLSILYKKTEEDDDINEFGNGNGNAIAIGANQIHPIYPGGYGNGNGGEQIDVNLSALKILSRFANPANVNAIHTISALDPLYKKAIGFRSLRYFTNREKFMLSNFTDLIDNFKHIVDIAFKQLDEVNKKTQGNIMNVTPNNMPGYAQPIRNLDNFDDIDYQQNNRNIKKSEDYDILHNPYIGPAIYGCVIGYIAASIWLSK